MSSSSSSGPSLGSNLALSIHAEILSAETPKDESSKAALINELKNRARVCIQSRNYPTAEALYTKAIQVLDVPLPGSKDSKSSKASSIQDEKDASILYSNRSLVYLQMNQTDQALDDAKSSTKLDPKYVKGFWRLGAAFAAKEQWSAAIEAFKDGVIIEPKNKTLLKEIERCQAMKVKADKMKESQGEEKKEDGKNTVIKKTITTTTTNTKSSSKKSSNSDKVILNDNDDEFTQSDHVRGYKIVGSKKTSFFHHEQSEEEKRLIGDIAPKRIDPSATDTTSCATPQQLKKDVSAWNKAGTWEEKDVTAWAKENLESQLLSATYNLPPSSPSPGSICKITKVKKCDGHASVATARGKRRYIYEFAVVLEWEMTLPQEMDVAKGTMTFPDIDGTCDQGEYEMMNYTVDPTVDIPGSARHLLDRFVKNGGLRDEIVGKIDDWVACFKSTYA